jgi:hypothetical protein
MVAASHPDPLLSPHVDEAVTPLGFTCHVVGAPVTVTDGAESST